jgi:hypothetical protein
MCLRTFTDENSYSSFVELCVRLVGVDLIPRNCLSNVMEFMINMHQVRDFYAQLDFHSTIGSYFKCLISTPKG